MEEIHVNVRRPSSILRGSRFMQACGPSKKQLSKRFLEFEEWLDLF